MLRRLPTEKGAVLAPLHVDFKKPPRDHKETGNHWQTTKKPRPTWFAKSTGGVHRCDHKASRHLLASAETTVIN